MIPTFLCTWSVLGKDGKPTTYTDKQSGKVKLKRYSKTYTDYTRKGALAQLRKDHADELIVKVNCEKVYA